MKSPWKFIPLQEYRGPKNANHATHGFWQRLTGFFRRDDAATRPKSPSSEAPNQAVRHPNWDGVVLALADALSSPKKVNQKKHQVRAVVGPPGSRVCEATRGWAQEHAACVVAPPTSDQILRSPDWWHDVRDNSTDLLVIPQLERWFLRHHDGLTGLRQLLQWLWSNPRPIVVGCDSWAWAYLRRAVNVDAVFHQPLAPAAVDGAQLKEWLGGLQQGAGNSANSAFWDSLASRARGVPGTAWHLYEQSLLHDDPVTTLPVMPDARGSVQALILHALLIHNGLSADVVLGLLPFPTSQIMAGVAWLENHRLVENRHDRWQVAPNAYASVRGFLGKEGFLVDAF
jgi:hypothetical protein